MSKHTPGPWEWQNGCSWWRLGTRFGNGDVICPTNHPTDRHPDLIVSKEDRDLIECAPEMLEALKDAYPFVADDTIRIHVGTIIAKAEGRS